MEGELPKLVEWMMLLGIKVDSELSFQPLLDACVSRYKAARFAPSCEMTSLAYPSRFRTCTGGWSQVPFSELWRLLVTRVVGRWWLGAWTRPNGLSLGRGGRVRIMHELGVADVVPVAYAEGILSQCFKP